MIMARYHNSAIQENRIRISQASNPEKDNKLKRFENCDI